MRSLLACPEAIDSDIYIFIDGPKDHKSRDLVDKTISVLRRLVGSSATFVISETNIGCRESIVTGVSRLCAQAGSAIAIEDDLVVHPAFLQYINDALCQLEPYSQVMHISGYMYPVKEFRNIDHGLFFPFMIPWGWATWARAWRHYDPVGSDAGLLQTDAKLRFTFDFEDARDYSGMLNHQLTGKMDAWDILWYWSMFRQGGLGYFPPQTLVKNIGFDGSGTHGFLSARFGIGRQILAPAAYRLSIPEVAPATGGVHKAMWRASAKIGKRGIVHRLKTVKKMLLPR